MNQGFEIMDGFQRSNGPIYLLILALIAAMGVGITMIGVIGEGSTIKQERRQRRLENQSKRLIREQRRELRMERNKNNGI